VHGYRVEFTHALQSSGDTGEREMKTITQKQIREKLLEDAKVLKVRISRDSDVSVYTEADRGDGGPTPWWQLKGNINHPDFIAELGERK